MTLKIKFFDNEEMVTFQNYLSEQQIVPDSQVVSGIENDKLTITGDFNPYDVTRIWSQVEVIRKCLPSTYKNTQLIYMEIYLALGGTLDHVSKALKDIPLFDIYLENYDYVGARDCIEKAEKYLSAVEKITIMSVLPQP